MFSLLFVVYYLEAGRPAAAVLLVECDLPALLPLHDPQVVAAPAVPARRRVHLASS